MARLDAYIRTSGAGSRSAAIQAAIRLLDRAGLEDDYSVAWDEWEGSGDAAAWQVTAADGLGGPETVEDSEGAGDRAAR